MVAMHMADRDHVNLAEAGIVRACHGSPGIIRKSGAIRVLNDHRPVEQAKLSIEAPQRGDFTLSTAGGCGALSRVPMPRAARPGRGECVRVTHLLLYS